MNYKKALKKIKAKVTSDFVNAPNPNLVFHNLDHTQKVVSRAKKIGTYYELEHKSLFILLASAWFHDIGYLFGKSKGHENRGAEIAGSYLSGENFDQATIETVKETITTATAEHQPADRLAQILYDADLYHLGTKGFFKLNKLVRTEAEWELGEKIAKEEWRQKTIEFLESHHFQTNYCREKLEKRKQKNLQKMKEKMMALTEETVDDKHKSEHEKKNWKPNRSVLKEG